MNESSSYRNHKNRPLYEGPPHQGLFRGTAGREIFLINRRSAAGALPVGGGDIHRNRWTECYQSPHHIRIRRFSDEILVFIQKF